MKKLLEKIFESRTPSEDIKVVKDYASYEDYCEHQKSKLSTLDMSWYDYKYHRELRARLRESGHLKRGTSVLCIAARLGTECRSFIDLGHFAIGIDLNPGEGNKYVVHGDFHDLQFQKSSLDMAFTNALDHALDLPKVLSEIHRVLKLGGLFIAEVMRGAKDEGGREPGAYESIFWDHNAVIFKAIEEAGFKKLYSKPFTYPWNGDIVIFRKRNLAK